MSKTAPREITPDLTLRQRQVLSLTAEGLTDREIAVLLGLARRTVEHHQRELQGNLGVNNRTHAVHTAWQRGLFERPSA